MPNPLPPPPPRSSPLFNVPMGLAKPEVQVNTGHKFSQPWSGWFRSVYNTLRTGKTQDVTIGGTTLHFVNGQFTGTTP